MKQDQYLLGIDIGSSSVKAAVVRVSDASCVGSALSPQTEMPISSPYPGRAEQDPSLWEEHAVISIALALKKAGIRSDQIEAVGITYQMHGLVCLDRDEKVLRPSIIWCDSRAVETGEKALDELGRNYCLEHYLNFPGNFTASKLAWVKQNEPEIFEKTDAFMLPGDWLAYRLTGEKHTTRPGLSEGILWDFRSKEPAHALLSHYGIPQELIPPLCETFGIQGRITKEASTRFSLPAGIPVSYRAGDQPNNAFSLRALHPGDIAATAGTSGVVYCVTDKPVYDDASRINTFVHVNDSAKAPRNGILLCINGTGISNSWIRKLTGSVSYGEMNEAASKITAGCDSLRFIPFGNGAERMLGNRTPGASFSNIDLNRHTREHVLRAVQEGIAFAFRYGLDIMAGMGINPGVIRAGKANLFLSPVFVHTLAGLCQVPVELYNTDGATGAALGAALGAGIFSSAEEALGHLECLDRIEPGKDAVEIQTYYDEWKLELEKKLQYNHGN